MPGIFMLLIQPFQILVNLKQNFVYKEERDNSCSSHEKMGVPQLNKKLDKVYLLLYTLDIKLFVFQN